MKALYSFLFSLLLVLTIVPAYAEPAIPLASAHLPPLALSDASPRLGSVDHIPLLLGTGSNRAFVLQRGGWKPIELPQRPGMVLSTSSDGVRTALLLGKTTRAEAAALLERTGKKITRRDLGPLPEPLLSAVSAMDDDRLVVAGLAVDGRPRLYDLALSGQDGWRSRPAWPGAEAPAALAAQNAGVFVTTSAGKQWRWFAQKGWRLGSPAPGPIVAGSSRPIGQAYLLYLARTGIGNGLFSYSAITDRWARLGTPIFGDPVAAVAAGDGLLIASRRADRLEFTTVTLTSSRLSFDLVDWLIIGLYLFGMLSIGLTFYRRTKRGPSAEFFLGSRAIPAWAAGISMFAGSISSISYLAVPAKAFETDWEYIMSKIATVCGLMFVAMFVVPVFRRLNLVSVFNYLQVRFHPVIRMLSSALWIFMQIGGRMGIVLYLPAMAIGTITHTNIIACIVIVGLFTIVYTALGGMRAVVWTDVFQVLVLTSGAFFAIGFVIYRIGLGQVLSTAAAFDKTRMLNFSFDITQPTVWAFLILALFDVVLTFPKDQVLMQRVLATPSEKAAKNSVWLFAVILLPSAFMFYIIGTVLFAYYRARPGQLNPLLPIDAVFPAFIGTELPHGVVGLIIAGLIAAAMGTLSGIINSVATLLSVDFYQRVRPDRTERQIVRFAELMSVVVGLVGIAIAIVLSKLDIHSLLDLTIELFGLLGGACAGAYTLGLFTRRANWQGVAIGIVTASILTFVVWWYALIHPYLYLALAIASSILIGYPTSLLFPAPSPKSLEGLTVFSRRRRPATEEPEPSIQVS